MPSTSPSLGLTLLGVGWVCIYVIKFGYFILLISHVDLTIRPVGRTKKGQRNSPLDLSSTYWCLAEGSRGGPPEAAEWSRVHSPSLPACDRLGKGQSSGQLPGKSGEEAGLGDWAHITGRPGSHWLTPNFRAVMMNAAESLPAVGTALGQAAGALRTPAGEQGGAGPGRAGRPPGGTAE